MRRMLTLILVSCSLLWSAGPARGAERPNIFWLVAEDFGPELGCYGTSQVGSPNLDRLAAQGSVTPTPTPPRPFARPAGRPS